MTTYALQKRVLHLLEPSAADRGATRWVDTLITALILLNILSIVLESVPALEARWRPWFHGFETVCLAVFTLEYLLRVWASGARHARGPGHAWRGRKEYLLSFYGWVDLLATLPQYLPWLFPGSNLTVLRILRLIRVFKLSHYSTAIEDLFAAVRNERRSFAAALYLLLIASLLSACLMYFAERHLQPDKLGTIPDALYWAFITLTTVGYGDVTPHTWLGRLLSMVTAFMGVSTVALLTGIVANAFANQMARRKAVFDAALKRALADGRVSSAESRHLEALSRQFNLTPEEVQDLVDLAQLEVTLRHRQAPPPADLGD